MPSQPQPQDSTLVLEFVAPVTLEKVGAAHVCFLDNNCVQLSVTKDIPAGSIAILPVMVAANLNSRALSPQPMRAAKFSSFDH